MKKIISLVIALAAVLSAASLTAFAADVPHISYKPDTGVSVNMYTGYVGGFPAGTTADGLTDMMKGPAEVTYKRGDDAISGSEVLHSGDTVTLGDLTLTLALMGDANNDGKINVSDVTLMLKYIAKWQEAEGMNPVYADANADGKVNVSDATLVLKLLAKWDVELAKSPATSADVKKGFKKTVSTCTKTGDGNYFNFCHGESLAIKFTVGENEVAEEFRAKTESWNNEGYPTHGEVYVSVYVWRESLTETLLDDAVYTTFCKDIPTGQDMVLSLTDPAGHGLLAGDYLIVFHDGYDFYDFDGSMRGFGVCTWAAPTEASGLRFWAMNRGEAEYVEWNAGFEGSIVKYDLK